MTTGSSRPSTIDEYISGFPEEIQEILSRVREMVRQLAPEADETISYQMPTFRLNGNLLHFAAFKNHLGFYPTPSGTEAFQQQLAPYIHGKGSIRFPFDQPIPYGLIAEIVSFRVQESQEKAKARKKKK